ncbi:DUF3800 domain-containing protein [Acetobacter tropicalis]|uniref:DUF3800 domain-containing protein n=1 Tax=Acetobacter tropicalis TaxID=104102 RepID=A0A251ZZV0_9PROT|nr:DUF3800 domain-containing protein [Acetobacter tropicalis]OUI80277.1 hypothetical protein HC62_17925 [Acetobacter tropicalis]
MVQTVAQSDCCTSRPATYYIDESGNTGDLTTAKIETYGKEQRMFTLAAVGCDLDQPFKDRFEALKAAHRIQSAEVKSRQGYERPQFVSDLLDLLDERGSPIFIEAVDKHYFVIANIIDRIVVPYVGACDVQPSALWMKGVMADHMAIHGPPELAQAFISCCQSRDYVEVRDFYKQIIRWAQSCRLPTEGVADAFVRFTRDSLKDFRKLPKARAVERALPISDTSPKGKLLWVLPNLTSFTHIYARINRFLAKQVSGVTLFHDEQLQFGDILRQNKMVMEAFTKEDVIPAFKTANFEFSASAKLEFMRSHDCIGIQIADVLAGFVARYIQDAVWGRMAMDPGRMSIFSRLVTAGVRERGTGVNIVAPESLVRFLGIAPRANYSS